MLQCTQSINFNQHKQSSSQVNVNRSILMIKNMLWLKLIILFISHIFLFCLEIQVLYCFCLGEVFDIFFI